ncbi:MAG: c-type cytochrome biogenesis protein CcsB [Deltaproteobacteria bacterium]|nr:c-type cytochrome biogenesis protein CcsB [Deltaproteobacteria bacterium]MBW2051192.1 c-type cytochrome biogenesis protein CcsB [Deltaproteobacteria bacterium]MBW2139833.1 c-type cytochrome biogenesis protein CcsB [Deltaproteobacteria bacterium]MBW2321998.1 c-type cytochrome biogenesis protein CcsB [Deltaproteobacteria bacterium]
MTFDSSFLLSIVTFAYLAASLAYICLLVFKTKFFGPAGTVLTLITLAAHTGAIIWRWVESYQLGIGHAPFSNLYESLIFFAWAITFLYQIMERIYKNHVIGAFVMPLAFLSLAYAGLQPKEIHPLVPALKSNWLIAHVITCFLAYAGFAVSAGLALILLLPRGRESISNLASRLPATGTLDSLIYQNIAFGFILLTAGIITGSIWAQQAWGSYWSWDPKETWSLVTWLVYAAVLHARMVKGWAGKRMAVMSLIGFASVLFTYFGVNLILSGLHSYAT